MGETQAHATLWSPLTAPGAGLPASTAHRPDSAQHPMAWVGVLALTAPRLHDLRPLRRGPFWKLNDGMMANACTARPAESVSTEGTFSGRAVLPH